MNKSNSTLQRLAQKLTLLDVADKRAYFGKLDIIIQRPHTIKSEGLQKRADARLNQISDQLTKSTYGIAYADGTEKITQLNRPAESNLLAQIQYLTKELYARLRCRRRTSSMARLRGRGTAQYWNRTVETDARRDFYRVHRDISPQDRQDTGTASQVFEGSVPGTAVQDDLGARHTLRDEVIRRTKVVCTCPFRPLLTMARDAPECEHQPVRQHGAGRIAVQAKPAQDEYDTGTYGRRSNGV